MTLLCQWDRQKDAKNRHKHGVSSDEARTVFFDPLAVTTPDSREGDEVRENTIGRSVAGRMLVVVSTERVGVFRLISARKPTRFDRENMKKAIKRDEIDEMLPEYDFSHGVRGKYYGKLTAATPIRITGEPAGSARKPAKPANGRNTRKPPKSRRPPA